MAATGVPASTAQIYRGFARQEARGRSPAYEALAEGVADDPGILRFVDSLPPLKRQPNLLFAAARYLLGVPADLASLRALVGASGPELTEVMLAGDRQERLAQAIAATRRDPPALHRGDLIDDLPGLAARAPAGATLVVYHSAVLAYVAPKRRRVFADLVRGLGAVWLSNEGPRVLADVPVEAFTGDPFLLVRDGRTPLAVADGHGAWLRWLS